MLNVEEINLKKNSIKELETAYKELKALFHEYRTEESEHISAVNVKVPVKLTLILPSPGLEQK